MKTVLTPERIGAALRYRGRHYMKGRAGELRREMDVAALADAFLDLVADDDGEEWSLSWLERDRGFDYSAAHGGSLALETPHGARLAVRLGDGVWFLGSARVGRHPTKGGVRRLLAAVNGE